MIILKPSLRDVLATTPSANRQRSVLSEKHLDAFAPRPLLRRRANKSNLLRRCRSCGTTSTQFQVASAGPPGDASALRRPRRGGELRELGTEELSG
ncbi:hypothetical protein EVAR_85796_1 [Eumeta japonica]|uniref:Uncharacterized protein n=1 Tax=Eumeta variegata TaxID=151549 RepID=A0A4C1URF0_EUMVA|nr:hypothetical protein EVAR_85796_1 [Eumeta japonica]